MDFEEILSILDIDDNDLYSLGLMAKPTDFSYDDSDDEPDDFIREITIEETKEEKPILNKITDTKIKPLVKVEDCYIPPPHENLLAPPFSLLMNGKPGSGKSTTLLNLLNFYKGYFDNIFIWSPTIYLDESWKIAIKDKMIPGLKKENIFRSFKETELKNIMKQIKRVNKQKKQMDKVRTLFIFDDIINELPRKTITSFNKLLFNHRHYMISHITLSQKYKSFPPKMRTSAFGLCLYPSDNNLERNAIIDECSGKLGKKLFEKIYDMATENKYSFLYLKPFETDINKKYFVNFDIPLFVSGLLETSDDIEDIEEKTD